MSEKPILFFFRGGRNIRLAAEGKFPSDLLYGYPELSIKYPIKIMEQDQLIPSAPDSWWKRTENRFRSKLTDVSYDLLDWYGSPENLKKLNTAKALYTTTVNQGVVFSILRMQGKLKVPFIFLATSLANRSEKKSFWRLMKKCAPHVIWASLSQNEARRLEELISEQVHYTPFGTDVEFWNPGKDSLEAEPPYFISVGNDAKRDYVLLLKAWKPEYPELRIVTQLELPKKLPDNVKKIDSDWCFRPANSNNVNDLLEQAEQLREMYRKSLAVIVPLQQTYQPSGQSVTQQGMATGRPVLVSKIHGIWNENVLKDEENILFCEPENITSLQNGVERLLHDKALRSKLSRNGLDVVRKYFTTRCAADSLEEVLKFHRIVS